jgi:hypothetical protein
MQTQITREEQIVSSVELFHQIQIAYTNNVLPTSAELLENKSLTDIEELTGEDSQASHGFAQFQFVNDRLGCGAKKSTIAIPEPKIPYVLNGTTIQVIEGGVDFTNNRIRISSLNLQGTFNDKITKLRFFGGLAHNTYKDVCNAIISIASGDTASSVLLKLANELTLQTKSSLKPLVANSSFTKYRGVVADKTALLALATPTNWDFAHVTADSDFYIYKNGKWLKTYIGTATPVNTTIYFVQSHSGSIFNHDALAIHLIDKNGNDINVAQNITTYSAGITTFDYKVGGVDVDTANRCVAGVGDLEDLSATQNVFDLIQSRLSDIEKPCVYWVTDITTIKNTIIPFIRNRYNKVSDQQIGKDLAGCFTFGVVKPVSGVDAMDDIFFDSTGEIRSGWDNNAQIQLVRFSTFADTNEHSDDLLPTPLYIKGIALQGGSMINYLTSRHCYEIAALQESFVNSRDVFLNEKAGHIQNISSNGRYIKDAFLNAVRSSANLPFYEQLKSNKRDTNPYSTDIIDGNATKYPFCFEEYLQRDGYNGYVLSSARSLTNIASALRKTNIQKIKLYFGWLVNFELKSAITNKAQSESVKKTITNIVKGIIQDHSSNKAILLPTAEQSPLLKEEFLQKTLNELTISSAIINGRYVYQIKCIIYPTNELEGVELTIISTTK